MPPRIVVELDLTVDMWGESINPEDYFEVIADALRPALDGLDGALNWTLAQKDR